MRLAQWTQHEHIVNPMIGWQLTVLVLPVQWNPHEKEWNCPCHGSCFSKTGTNLMGPSTIDMSPLKHLSD